MLKVTLKSSNEYRLLERYNSIPQQQPRRFAIV